MSFNGSGTFLINSAGQPVVTNTTITSTAFNLLTADLATGLSTCLTKDGQTTPTANIPMGTFKITGLGNGTVATDAAAFGQITAFGVPGYTTTATAAGSTTLTVASTYNQYFTGVTTQTVVLPVTSTLVLGFQFRIVNMSTGVVTVNPSGGQAVVAMVPLSEVTVTCILTSGTTAASWDIQYSGKTAVTGTGALALAVSPSFTTPALGVASATSLATSAASPLLLTNGQLVSVALTAQTTGATTLTIPDFASVVDEFVFKTKAVTLANKTLTSPAINGTVTTSGLTMPAFTLGGTVSGGGNQINNVIIGTSTPLAGAFTTLSSTGQYTNTVADGTTPMVVTSTTTVANLKAAAAASIPQNSKSAAYTTVLADAGKHILHPTADNNARTFTIDSNANVAYPIGTTITFVNQINTVTISITSDTLTLCPAGTTGSRTLAANGVATAMKVSTTGWVITGVGLT